MKTKIILNGENENARQSNKEFEKHKMNYHLEFQTKNDNTMIIRMFEYEFRKGKENANEGKDNIKRLYFPKQKVGL